MATVTFKGEAVELEGTPVELNQAAPDFEVNEVNGGKVSKSDFAGKVLLLSVVPDIDTSVCSIQSNRISDYAKQAGEGVEVATVSMNTDESLTNWKSENDSDMRMLNDAAAFGKDYGIFLPELGKLARAMFVIDTEGNVVYKEIVNEVTNEPDYENAIQVVDSLA
ncbi:peroxiredoxin [Aerococcus urinaeequi]|uniref:thiol peroxidase n=1 Tax=Aerococcus urinaeequi TaxID=51665 RepID=UPI0039BCE6C7